MEKFLEVVTKVNGALNSFAWGPIMLLLLVGSGVYLSIRTGFIQVGKFGYIMKNTVGSLFRKSGKKLPFVMGIIVAVLGVLAVITNLGVQYPWLTVGIPALPSLYFDWFGGCIQAFIFCTLTTLFIKQAAGD